MGDEPNERTCYVTNLSEQVTQPILEEMFVQMGPVEKVILNTNKGFRYSLVVFKDSESVIFASICLDKIPLFGMEISVRPKGHSLQEEKYKELLAKMTWEKQQKQQNYAGYAPQMSFEIPSPFLSPQVHGHGGLGRSGSDRRDNRNGHHMREAYNVTPSTSMGNVGYEKEQRMGRRYQGTPYERTPVNRRPRIDVQDALSGISDRERFMRKEYPQQDAPNPVRYHQPNAEKNWRAGAYRDQNASFSGHQLPGQDPNSFFSNNRPPGRDQNSSFSGNRPPGTWNKDFHQQQQFRNKTLPRHHKF